MPDKDNLPELHHLDLAIHALQLAKENYREYHENLQAKPTYWQDLNRAANGVTTFIEWALRWEKEGRRRCVNAED